MTPDATEIRAQFSRLRNQLQQLDRVRRLPVYDGPPIPEGRIDEGQIDEGPIDEGQIDEGDEGPAGSGSQVVEEGAPSYVRLWGWTAITGTAILALIFGGYELLERTALAHADAGLINALHLLRGMGSAIVLGTWAFLVATRTRRHYARSLTENIRRLETEVQRRTSDLERSHAFTEHLFDTLRDRIVVTDAAGDVVKVNRVARESVPDGCEARCDEAICEQECKVPASHRDRIFRDASSGRLFEVDRYPIPAREGDRALVLEVARDVTESKRLEALVVHHEKMASLGVLAAGIAHDIGNPLASLSSELELLEAEDDPGAVKDSLGVLNTHVERISRALREMVDFARRRGEDEPGQVDVRVAIEDACRLVRHDKRMRNVTLRTEIDHDLPPVRIVEDHLVMVLVNLALNALDAMPAGGALDVRARSVDGEVRVEVSDTGIGMTEEVLAQAFDPLFSTKGEDGTGLGLSVSQSVIRAAGGRMEISSTPNAGTAVILTLRPGDVDG